jgi:hypothetical protein
VGADEDLCVMEAFGELFNFGETPMSDSQQNQTYPAETPSLALEAQADF